MDWRVRVLHFARTLLPLCDRWDTHLVKLTLTLVKGRNKTWQQLQTLLLYLMLRWRHPCRTPQCNVNPCPDQQLLATKAVFGVLPRYISWGQTMTNKTYQWSMGMGIKPLQICTPGSEELYFSLIQKAWREVPAPDRCRQSIPHGLLCQHWR